MIYDIIIKEKEKRDMEERNNIYNKYRKSHHRCRYCEFLKVRQPPTGDSYFVCELKDKTIAHDLSPINGLFCKWYLPRVKKKE